jgi:hypothetical protein
MKESSAPDARFTIRLPRILKILFYTAIRVSVWQDMKKRSSTNACHARLAIMRQT